MEQEERLFPPLLDLLDGLYQYEDVVEVPNRCVLSGLQPDEGRRDASVSHSPCNDDEKNEGDQGGDT